VNWLTAGGEYGTRAATLNAPSGYNTNVWDAYTVTSAVQDFVANPSQNHGLLFVCTDGSDGHGYYTSDYSDVSKRPKLTVTYTVQSTAVTPLAEAGNSDSPAPLRIHRGTMSWNLGNAAARVSVLSLDGRLVGTRTVTGRGSFTLPAAAGARVTAVESDRNAFEATVSIDK